MESDSASQAVEITTNNVPRELISFSELTDKERKDFDYVPGDEYYDVRFFRYKGEVYDTGDCERAGEGEFKDWDGIFRETFFSGVLFKWVKATTFDDVIVGRYCV